MGPDPRPAAPGMFDGAVDHGERLETKKIELHQSGAFHPFHIELRGRQAGARIAIEGRELGQRSVSDHHARGMGGGVTIQALKLKRGVQNLAHRLIVAPSRLKAGLQFDRLSQGDGIGGVVGDHLGQAVHLSKRQLHLARPTSRSTARATGRLPKVMIWATP